MNRFTNWILVLAALGLCFVDIGKASELKAKYAVYGGTCSRSIRLIAEYNSISEACWAAEELRKRNDYVGIASGRPQDPLFIHPSCKHGKSAACYSVYYRFCKTLQLNAIVQDESEARKIADKLVKENGGAAEIVHNALRRTASWLHTPRSGCAR